jgi:hypothetical protein
MTIEEKIKFVQKLDAIFLVSKYPDETREAIFDLFSTALSEARENTLRECIEEFNHPEWCYDKAKQFKECPRCILEAKLGGVKE